VSDFSVNRRQVLLAGSTLAFWTQRTFAQTPAIAAEQVLQDWYRLVLMLVRHTPTYSPPVASRAFAYLGITVHESVAVTDTACRSLADQLQDLGTLPRADKASSLSHILHAALERGVTLFFGNTGPTGQRSIKAMSRKISASLMGSVADDVAVASENLGAAIAEHVFAWSKTDGGHVVDNLGFPMTYPKAEAQQDWVPTSPITLQQTPLLPNWGENRTFAMANGKACALPPPPVYSEDKSSDFYKEALEVYGTVKTITPEQRAIARFWSDDPMLSPTPPGHWVSIALQLFAREKTDVQRSAAILAQLGIAVADAFIGCWATKYEYDLLRPITYIKRVIDPMWMPILITPPFPEYPSGHSTQSAAAAVVLTQAFGENFGFEDATHVRDGLKPRQYKSFDEAAREAALSRLYGGIHFRSGIERGLDQGRCIGAHALSLKFTV
jgi:hypothetical protein